MARGELNDIAAKVLAAHVVAGAVIAPLEHRPEGFDPVGVGHAVHILADTVLDGLMLERHPPIPAVIVCVDCRPLGSVIADKLLKRPGVRPAYHGGIHAVGLAVLGAHNDRLADTTPAGAELLVSVLVLLLAADASLIDFNRA